VARRCWRHRTAARHLTVLPIIDRPRWMRDAACRGVDPELFFTRRGDQLAVQSALATSAACPVRSGCAEYGMDEQISV
jgi:hypothetical protein